MRQFRRPYVLLTANTFFALYNFRLNLIKQLIRSGFSVILCAESDGYEDKFLGLEVKVISCGKSRTKLLRHTKLMYVTIHNILKENPDYVFSFTLISNFSAGFSRGLRDYCFIPNVTGLGRSWSNRLSRYVVSFFYKFLFKKARAVLVQNNRDKLIFDNLLRGKVNILKVNGSGIDLKNFSARKPQINNKPISFTMVSRLVREKGYLLYLEVLNEIKTKYGDQVNVDFVSGYNHSDKILNALKSKYFNVNFLPFIENIPDYLAEIDVSVLPSTYNEGTPRILIESLAAGCALITSLQPGCDETVVDGENGFLLNDVCRAGLWDAVERYIALSLEKRKKMSRKSIFLSRQDYDEQDIINLYLKLM